MSALPYPLASRARPGAPWIRRWRPFGSAPLTVGYLLVLTATTLLVSVASERIDDRLLFGFSTNLHQLARVPARVLVGSALWTSGWGELGRWLVLFAAVLAPVERRLGSRRTLLAFAAGHVGATAIVAVGLWIALNAGDVSPTIVVARDVGASYGFFAVAALAGYLLAPRARLCYLTALVGYLAVTVGLSPTFTNAGHLTALGIGLACYPLARERSASVRRRARELRWAGYDEPVAADPLVTTEASRTWRGLPGSRPAARRARGQARRSTGRPPPPGRLPRSSA